MARTRSSDQRTRIDRWGDQPLWHVRTPASSLIVGVTDNVATQRFWGARLGDDDVAAFAEVERQKWNSSFQRPAEHDELLPINGGHRWLVPSLEVTYPGGIRALELTFVSGELDEQDAGHLVLTFVDQPFQLDVELHLRVTDTSDVIERWTVLHNRGGGPVDVSRFDSASWLLPDQSEYRASTVHGYWSAEMQLQRAALPFGEYTLSSRHGTTGQQSNPWMMIDDGTATETSGEVRTVALGWSGSWHLTAQRRPEGVTSVTCGMGHSGIHWPLDAGATRTSPVSYGLYSTHGFGGASRQWHAFVRAEILPHADEVRPVLFNSWEATGFDISVENQAELARRAADMGVELFVVDDGWFGARTSDRAGLGDWHPNPMIFPDGLAPLIAQVRALGMGFGIWVEPEMVNPDSDLYRAHPDWVLHWPGRTRDERRHQLVLNFARDDVRAWAMAWLDDLVASNGIDFIKWDMNRPFTQAGWPDAGDHQDLLWIEHTRGVYHVIDALRARHPHLRIETCSSGGGRVDLEIFRRTDQAWTSDNTDALDRQVIQHGFSQLYPAVAMGAWVTDAVNAMTGRSVPLDYRFHVAMAGNLGIGGNLIEWSVAERDRAGELIAQYKVIRETVQHGELYRLGGLPGREYSALEYVSKDQVAVFMYEPQRSLAATPRRLRLRGLDADARYRDSVSGDEVSGAVLMQRGILFNDAQNLRGTNNTRFSTADYASSLIILERVP